MLCSRADPYYQSAQPRASPHDGHWRLSEFDTSCIVRESTRKPRIAACRDHRRWVTKGLLELADFLAGTLQNMSHIRFKFLLASGDIRSALLELLEIVRRRRELPGGVGGCRDVTTSPPHFLYTSWLNQLSRCEIAEIREK